MHVVPWFTNAPLKKPRQTLSLRQLTGNTPPTATLLTRLCLAPLENRLHGEAETARRPLTLQPAVQGVIDGALHHGQELGAQEQPSPRVLLQPLLVAPGAEKLQHQLYLPEF